MRGKRIVGGVVALALGVGGCGDDGGGDEAADGATTATSTSVATTTVSEESGSTTTGPPVDPTTTEEAPRTVTVIVPDHPMWDTDVLTPSPERLDALAADYLAEAGDDPSMERFLFGSVPVTVFDEIFADGTDVDTGELFWLLHLSGYFGGRWLRGEIADAQPDAPLVGFSNPPTEEAFGATMTRAAVRLAAVDDEATVVDAARDALFDEPPPAEGEEPIRGVTDSFGYNVGYMLEILATPPDGVEPSPRFQVTCDGLFSCRYASPKLAVLPTLAEVESAINAPDSEVADLVAELRPVQDAAEPRGRGVWSGGLSVQGFDQESYDQLLDVSSSFLETVQATGLVNIEAVLEDDPSLAAVGIVAEAAQIVWLDAYIAGLTDGEGEIELPTFS